MKNDDIVVYHINLLWIGREHVNYEHYRVFITVGRHQNITRAAEELFSSQPAVTRIIHNMEAELGCRLFVRSKNGVEFTREGKDLYDLIAAPCNLLMRADQDLRKLIGRNEGTIHIGTTYTALQCFIFNFLDEFHRKYENINFRIYTGSSSRMIARLVRGEIDLVFNTTPFSGAESLRVTPVHPFSDVLVGGSAFAHLQGRVHPLRELQEHPFILLSRGMQYRQFCDDFFARCGVHITPSLEADSSGLIVPMVTHNWGLALVPEVMADEALRDGRLVKIAIEEKIPQRHITMVTNPQHPISNAVQLMCDMVTEARQS